MNARLELFSDMDTIRLRRAKELSELNIRMSQLSATARFGIHSKSVIVLSYAHWEGFYNDCISIYIRCLKGSGKKVSDVSWSMLIGLLQPDFQRLKDRNHSHMATAAFAVQFKDVMERDFTDFDKDVVSSRSNLDFKKLRQNFEIMGLDYSPFLRWRLRIDNELVRWRHSVAHGDDPDLSAMDIKEHVTFTQRMLLVLSDLFQEEILKSIDS